MFSYKVKTCLLHDWLALDNETAFKNKRDLGSIVNAVLLIKAQYPEFDITSCWLEAWYVKLPFQNQRIVILRDNPHGEGYIISPIQLTVPQEDLC